MAYAIEFKKSAAKEFRGLPARIQTRIQDALHLLAVNPRTEILHIKQLKGAEGLFRLRLRDYRVVYELKREAVIIVVIKLAHRSEIYRKL